MRIVEFYKIVEGSTEFHITSSDSIIEYLGDTYIPVPVGRSEAEIKNELSKANIELTLGIDDPIAQRYMNSIVDAVVSLTCFSMEDSDVTVAWKGRLSAVKPETAKVKLVFESVFTSLRRPGLRRRYQRNCQHVLYGRGCNLDKENFDYAGIATAVNNGNTITVPIAAPYANDTFTGGMLEAPDLTLRFIISHIGDQLELIRSIESLNTAILSGPQNIRIFPGCDRTRETCQSKFNNLNNNGSFPFIPIRNPYSGSSFN